MWSNAVRLWEGKSAVRGETLSLRGGGQNVLRSGRSNTPFVDFANASRRCPGCLNRIRRIRGVVQELGKRAPVEEESQEIFAAGSQGMSSNRQISIGGPKLPAGDHSSDPFTEEGPGRLIRIRPVPGKPLDQYNAAVLRLGSLTEDRWACIRSMILTAK